MPTITLPVTTYSVRSNKPTTRYGSPALLPLREGGPLYFAFGRMSWDRIPRDATILSAVLKARVNSSGKVIRAYSVNKDVVSSVTYSTRPGAVAQVGSGTSVGTVINIPLTAWAASRNSRGLLFRTDTSTGFSMYGSASTLRPVLEVEYSQLPDSPGGLRPSGGAVSVPKPVLTYSGDDSMTDQQIQIDIGDDGTINHDSGWVPATTGYFEQPPEWTALTEGQVASWRVRVRNTYGESAWSSWLDYSYAALPTVTINQPGATSPDGSPTLDWTSSGQARYQAFLYDASNVVKDRTAGWVADPDETAWTPKVGVPVPNRTGDFVLRVADDVLRVDATNAPTYQEVRHRFTTTLVGAGAGMDTIEAVYDEPVVVLSGTRFSIPDEVSVLRDGEQITLWDSDGLPTKRIPGIDVFEGTDFVLRDYTASLRGTHTWQVIAWANGVPSSINPSASLVLYTPSIWLVNPRTDERIEVVGINEIPVVSQETTESSILHTPVAGSAVVEPVRRRLMRTTRSGSISGAVMDNDADTLEDWALASAGERYRLVFGKVNWPVILGDYSPVDVSAYPDSCGPDQTLISMNWWQRLADF